MWEPDDQPPIQPRRTRQLAKPNYEFAKRQRDLAKKRKKEEKKLRKAGTAETPGAEGDAEATAPAPADDKTVA